MFRFHSLLLGKKAGIFLMQDLRNFLNSRDQAENNALFKSPNQNLTANGLGANSSAERQQY